MMRALFLCVAIWTLALGVSAADAESAKPKYPAEIVAASARIAQRNEDCSRQAREQHLHLRETRICFPASKVNTDAISRTTQLVQEGFVKITERAGTASRISIAGNIRWLFRLRRSEFSLSFPKIQSGGIRTMRENQRIILSDVRIYLSVGTDVTIFAAAL